MSERPLNAADIEDEDDLLFASCQKAAGRSKPTNPVKRKKTEDKFVKLPLWWAEGAAKAIGSPATLVLVELLRLRWTTHSSTFPVPNCRLRGLGVSREVKRRVLADLERAGFVTIERPERKTPLVTMVAM
jgi:hypothetical protein